ncbi:hypothetical protein [Catenulispora rubra]|uniref:hypothetical protein n=1 Tax=Catenulispora rubra TaxID=280293 RepID=UPI0018924E17|nr:hypothetical protein [Catenulispora rubra]
MGTPDYWGAPVPQLPVCPTAGYFAFPSSLKAYTPRPENNNTAYIEDIRQQIMNQHPEQMSAAADQWQNLHDFISGIGDQIRAKSQTLHDETWKSPQAAAEFLKRGPGATLAALDQWKAAAAANRDALRALVGMATKARSDMDTLWSQYLNDVDRAKYLHVRSDFGDFLHWVWSLPEGIVGYYTALPDYEKQKVNAVHDDYSQRARVLVYQVAEAYFEIVNHYGVGSSGQGIGPSFKPMNARLSAIGMSPPPGAGSVPPLPASPAVPPRPQITAPPTPGAAPVAPQPPVVPPPVVPAGLSALRAPGSMPGVVPGAVPGPVPGLVPGLRSGGRGPQAPALDGLNVRGADGPRGLIGGVLPPVSAPEGLVRPGGLGSGRSQVPDANALRGPFATPETTTEPLAALRSPSATGAGGRPLSGTGSGMEEPPPGRGQSTPEQGRRRVWEPTQGTEEAFAPPPGGKVPGVLSGPQLGGSSGRTGLGSGFGEPPAVRAAATEAATTPQRRRTKRPTAPAEPGTEWLGMQEALDGVAEPVLNAASETVVSEETSVGLRTTGSAAVDAPAPARTRRRAADQDTETVAPGEEAWTVATPGGGVLGAQATGADGDEPEPTLRAAQA